jgi:hypothetical protein
MSLSSNEFFLLFFVAEMERVNEIIDSIRGSRQPFVFRSNQYETQMHLYISFERDNELDDDEYLLFEDTLERCVYALRNVGWRPGRCSLESKPCPEHDTTIYTVSRHLSR